MKPDDQIWKRLARHLASVRRRKTLLFWLSLPLFFAVLALLFSARHVANQTGDIPWSLYLLVALCLGILLLFRILYNKS
jgi:hypothetical protein